MLRPKLISLLEDLYRQGYRRFFNGAAKGFDLLAAECVLQFQVQHPDVSLLLAIPYAEQSRSWSFTDVERYHRICYCADAYRLLTTRYYHGCLLARNRYMVDRSSYCICYMQEPKGGTGYTVAYALRQDIEVTNLAI